MLTASHSFRRISKLKPLATRDVTKDVWLSVSKIILIRAFPFPAIWACAVCKTTLLPVSTCVLFPTDPPVLWLPKFSDFPLPLTFLHSSWLCPHRQKSQLICFPVCIDVFFLNSSWGFLVFRGFLWYSSRSSTSWPKMSESGSKFHSWWSSPLVMVRRSYSGSFSNNDGTTMAEYVSWSHQVVPRRGAWSRRSRTRLEASVHLVRYRCVLCSWGLWCAFFGWQSFFHNFSLAAPSLLYNLLT